MTPTGTVSAGAIVYPESDGLPMADNSKQFRWIFALFGNLAALFRDRPDVYVSGNQFWYPEEGNPHLRVAPDVYVVFGRPKGDRPSYKQWEEDGVPMTVVFEVLSPGNTYDEMADKQAFYDDHGVQEYYIYDPDHNRLSIFIRRGEVFRREREVNGFVSPLLGIRFDLSGPEMVVRFPDGQPFETFEEVKARQEQERHLRQKAEHRAETAEHRAETAEHRAETAEHRAETAEYRAETAEHRADQALQLVARLAELAGKVHRGEASDDELRELEQLTKAARRT
jgi:Uma2 family endonuclease